MESRNETYKQNRAKLQKDANVVADAVVKRLGTRLDPEKRNQKMTDLQNNDPITKAELQFLMKPDQEEQRQLLVEMASRLKGIQEKLQPNANKRTFADVAQMYMSQDPIIQQKIQKAMDEIEDVYEPYKGYGVQEALAATGQDISWQQLQDRKRQTKLQFANAFLQEKVGGAYNGSAASLQQLLQDQLQSGSLTQEEVTFLKEKSSDVIRKLVLLDDWQNIKNHAWEAVKTVGPMALKMLAKRYLPNIEFGADSGGWIGDYNSKPENASKQFLIPSGNTHSSIERSMTRNSVSMHGASAKYVATFICPERFTFRRPQQYPVKSALVGSTQELVLNSDTKGNAAIYINPNAPFVESCQATANTGGTTVTGLHSFWAFSPTKAVTNKDINYVPETGSFDNITGGTAQSDNIVNIRNKCYAGPLFQYASSIRRLKTSGFSVTFTPTSSINDNSGSVVFGYFPYSSVQNLLGQPQGTGPTFGQQIGTNQITQSQYCQLGNTKTSYRFTHIPDSVNDLALTSAYVGLDQVDELYVLVVTGAPVSANIGKIEISYDYEYIPSFNSQLLAQQDYPNQGVRTADLINNLVQQFPTLLSMNFDDSYRLANALVNNVTDDYDEIQQFIQNYMDRNVMQPQGESTYKRTM